jgi:hypothetical protein
MSDLEVKKDWMDYTNLAANIHQSIKLGEISNQLSQLTSINTAMLGNMNNLVNIEVYKLEQEDNEKQFKQLLFNLKKFVKTKYEDPLTVALLKNGHCKMIDSLLDNFQRELKSFEDKEYVENIMDSFSEYSSTDVDFEALAKENENGVTLLLSYMMFTDQMTSNVKELANKETELETIIGQYYTEMKNWTPDSLNVHLQSIDSPYMVDKDGNINGSDGELVIEIQKSATLMNFFKIGHKFQIVFDKDKKIEHLCAEGAENMKQGAFRPFVGVTFQSRLDKKKIEAEKMITDLDDKVDTLQTTRTNIDNSIKQLKANLKDSNAEWINIEKKLLNIMYDTTLPIQGPYQYRKQVIGD